MSGSLSKLTLRGGCQILRLCPGASMAVCLATRLKGGGNIVGVSPSAQRRRMLHEDYITEAALRRAAAQGRVEDIALLLKEGGGVRPDAPDVNGYTPLMHACGDIEGSDVKKVLVRAGTVRLSDIADQYAPPSPPCPCSCHAPPRSPCSCSCNSTNSNSNSSNASSDSNINHSRSSSSSDSNINHSSSSDSNINSSSRVAPDHVAVVQELLRRGAQLEATSKGGMTALLFASRDGCSELVHLLLREGANMEAANARGLTALMLGAAVGHTSVVRLLLDAGAAVDATDKHGGTALLHASRAGGVVAAELLLRAGARLEARDERGATPLLRAAAAGKEAMLTLLLDNGARLDVLTKDGETALSLSEAGRHYDVSLMLLRELERRGVDGDKKVRVV